MYHEGIWGSWGCEGSRVQGDWEVLAGVRGDQEVSTGIQ
jgi:hypothetical protein